MKEIAVIDGIVAKYVGNDAFEQLVNTYPQGQRGYKGNVFSMSVDIDDSRLQDIERILMRHGLNRWNRSRRLDLSNEYSFQVRREYDNADLGSSAYLELSPGYDRLVKAEWRRPRDPQIVLEEEPPDADIVSSFMQRECYLVSERAKVALESEEVAGLIWTPTVKKYSNVSFDADPDRWWQLQSQFQMPPVSPSMELIHKDHTPFTGDFSKGCRRVEGFYFPVELHYRRGDVGSSPTYDLAHTYEMFGTLPNDFDRPLVASQRFYQLCQKHHIRTGWVPVRIDEE